MKKVIWSLLLTSLAFAGSPAKNIHIGTTAGDFADMVKDSIKPQLEKKGYTVKLTEFTDYVRPNLALSEGSLDVNIFQHKQYLENFSKEHKLNLKTIAQVPTAPLCLYPGKTATVTALKEGSKVAVPNDPTNLARALVILSDLGWVTLKKNIDPLRVSTADIESNVKKISIVQLEAAQLPRARQDVDYAIINGNYATSSGLKLTDALFQEKSYAYVNWVVVNAKDAEKEFSKDLVQAYESAEFKAYAKKKYAGYKFPQTW